MKRRILEGSHRRGVHQTCNTVDVTYSENMTHTDISDISVNYGVVSVQESITGRSPQSQVTGALSGPRVKLN